MQMDISLKLFKNFYFRRYRACDNDDYGLKLFKNFYFRRSITKHAEYIV